MLWRDPAAHKGLCLIHPDKLLFSAVYTFVYLAPHSLGPLSATSQPLGAHTIQCAPLSSLPSTHLREAGWVLIPQQHCSGCRLPLGPGALPSAGRGAGKCGLLWSTWCCFQQGLQLDSVPRAVGWQVLWLQFLEPSEWSNFCKASWRALLCLLCVIWDVCEGLPLFFALEEIRNLQEQESNRCLKGHKLYVPLKSVLCFCILFSQFLIEVKYM